MLDGWSFSATDNIYTFITKSNTVPPFLVLTVMSKYFYKMFVRIHLYVNIILFLYCYDDVVVIVVFTVL